MTELQTIIDQVLKEIAVVRKQAEANKHYAQGAEDALKRVVDEWNKLGLPDSEKQDGHEETRQSE